MATILTYPHPALRGVAAPVTVFDDALYKLAEDMAVAMYLGLGCGLAAPQIGVMQRVIVVDTTDGRDLHTIVNPVIVEAFGGAFRREGCLSFPGKFLSVGRAEEVVVVGQSVRGHTLTIPARGFLAQALQHEIDHLDGRLFVDLVTRP